MTFAAILMLGTGCATSIAVEPSLNPFCTLVGPPPGDMIPEAGAPTGWVDEYLAVYDETCG